jgi:hypothetical protein
MSKSISPSRLSGVGVAVRAALLRSWLRLTAANATSARSAPTEEATARTVPVLGPGEMDRIQRICDGMVGVGTECRK